jgi:hypothetical protein
MNYVDTVISCNNLTLCLRYWCLLCHLDFNSLVPLYFDSHFLIYLDRHLDNLCLKVGVKIRPSTDCQVVFDSWCQDSPVKQSFQVVSRFARQTVLPSDCQVLRSYCLESGRSFVFGARVVVRSSSQSQC